jgi:hypothetical protein
MSCPVTASCSITWDCISFRDFITKALDHLLLLVSALRVNPGNSRGVQIGCKRGTKLVHSHRPTRSRNQDYPLTGPRPGASPTIYVRKNTPKHFPKRHGFFSLAMWKSWNSKRLSVWNKSLRNGWEWIPTKNPAVGVWRGKRGDCGREEGDGRKEGTVTPLEPLRTILPVADDRVPSVLWRLLTWLSKEPSCWWRRYTHEWQSCLHLL